MRVGRASQSLEPLFVADELIMSVHVYFCPDPGESSKQAIL